MSGNWIDWMIFVVLAYYAFQGYQTGFADLGLSFITFTSSFFLALKFHAPVGDFIMEKFGVPQVWTTVLGYVIVGFVAEAILGEIAALFVAKIPKKFLDSMYNRLLGICISVANGLVVIAFFLFVITMLPLRGTIKADVKSSTIGGWLIAVSQRYGGPIESTIEKAKDTAIAFLTVEPQSTERLTLPVTPKASDVRVDDVSERAMLALVNQERKNAGVGPLTIDVRIIPVARAHSKDMFLKGYFSHESLDGLSPGDRLARAGISFSVAGENLAYAPDLATAHTGLMNSPGHKKNILDPSFHHVGIGIIATDNFGIMVTQDFTN